MLGLFSACISWTLPASAVARWDRWTLVLTQRVIFKFSVCFYAL